MRTRSYLVVLGVATSACMAERGPFANRMAHSGTSYLARAARQPVNWQPWGREAFALAVRLDRPVLLYVGSDACQLCAETDRAIYTDPEIGALINSLFVPIRVDRNERPDVAQRYQGAVELLAGLHGWPLTVVLTSDGAPFFGGTYFPADDPVTGRGLKQVLPEIAQRYRDQRAIIDQQGTRIRQLVLRGNDEARGLLRPGEITRGIAAVAAELDAAVRSRRAMNNDISARAVSLLLGEYARSRDTAMLAVARRALDRQLDSGGGLATAATDDPPALVRATLLGSVAQAWVVTGEPRYREAGRALARRLARDLPDLAGASSGPAGPREVFSDQLAYMIEKLMLGAATLGEASLEQRARAELDALLQRGYARGPEEQTSDGPEETGRGEGGEHGMRHAVTGNAAFAGGLPLGFLQDQVQVAAACLAAYQLTNAPRYLAIAQDLAAALDRSYGDPYGGYYESAEPVPDRTKPIFDDVLPGGNAVAADVLARLAVATGNTAYRRRAQATLEAFGGRIGTGTGPGTGEALRVTTFLAAAREILATP